jgi:adenylosuccinate lyase
MAAVRAGVGRETAHEAIKEHAVAVALSLREQGAAENDLLDRLASDTRLGLSMSDLRSLISEPLDFTGAASAQVQTIIERVAVITARHPGASAYQPGDIL